MFVQIVKNGVFSYSQKSCDTWSFAIDSAHNSIITDVVKWTYTPSGTLSETGAGEEFLPPYMTVYAWYRTA